MDHAPHSSQRSAHDGHHHPTTASLNATALRATLHCLSGCAVGEVAW